MYEFDDNGVIYWGRHDKPAMKQFRQIRATLRSVCQGWKELVDSPYIEHRCMRFCIPSHMDEDQNLIRAVNARRIEIITPPGVSQLPDGVLEQVQSRRFNTEILLDIGGKFFNQILPAHEENFPFLTTLVVDFQNHSLHLLPETLSSISLPRLDFLTTLILRLRETQDLDNGIFGRLPNLSTLSLQRVHKLPYLDFSQWCLPLLCHLELESLYEPGDVTYLFKQLPLFSQHLRFLRIVPSRSYHILPIELDSLWLCDKLERLEIPLQLLFMWGGEPQRLSCLKHIVHTEAGPLAMTAYLWCRGDYMKLYGGFIGFCLALRALKTVTDSHGWNSTLENANTPLQVGQLPPNQSRDKKMFITTAAVTVSLAQKLQDIGIRYEDRNCKTLVEAKAQMGVL